MKNKDIKISLIFTFIGLIAGMFLAVYQVSMATEIMKQDMISRFGSTTALIAISAAQVTVFAFLSSFIGLKLARRTNLKLNFNFNKKSTILATVIGMVAAIIIVGSDKFIFAPYLPAQTEAYVFSPIYFMASVLYGGVVEELMLRLLIMSLMVLILWKLFARLKGNSAIPNWIYIMAIFLAAIIFAAAHLPATAQLLGLSTPIFIRAMVLNGIAGLGFGYLYWKKGLAYSIYAHMITHIFMQIIFMPILY